MMLVLELYVNGDIYRLIDFFIEQILCLVLVFQIIQGDIYSILGI